MSEDINISKCDVHMPIGVNPLIIHASTIIVPSAKLLYDPKMITYGRAGVEPQRSLETELTCLERGYTTRLFPSGLSALSGVLLCLLSPGDELLVVDCVYGRTRRFCDEVLKRLGIHTTYVSARVSPEELTERITSRTKGFLLESPGSLSFEVQDVPALAAAARKRGIITLIDNTWSAGELFKPLDMGVDISIQSLTKYVCGYSDAFMGAVVVRDRVLADRVDETYFAQGWSVGPDDCYRMVRGLQTLKVRLAAHQLNAAVIYEWLSNHSMVSEVLVPYCPRGNNYHLWHRDFTGHNGLISFVLSRGTQAAAFAFLDALKIFRLGFSWGGFESLALYCNPQMLSRRQAYNADEAVIRLHIGLQDPSLLIDDLAAGFRACKAEID